MSDELTLTSTPVGKIISHIVAGLLLLFSGWVVVYSMIWGNPANTLHVSAQSWAFFLMGCIGAGYGLGAVVQFIPLMLGKKV